MQYCTRSARATVIRTPAYQPSYSCLFIRQIDIPCVLQAVTRHICLSDVLHSLYQAVFYIASIISYFSHYFCMD